MPLLPQETEQDIHAHTNPNPRISAMPTYTRIPTIETDPLHPGAKNYTDYQPAAHAERVRARSEVQQVLNESFIARTLKVITRNGESKNFETITGEDGLTFGIKDFISDTVPSLMKAIHERAPQKLEAAFGARAGDVIPAAWTEAHRSKANDKGIVAIGWFRRGLDQLLCDRQLHAMQLQFYQQETIAPSLELFREHKYRLEFTFAAFAGIANSFGGGGLSKLWQKAKGSVQKDDEVSVIQELVTLYATREAGLHDPATKQLLNRGFGKEHGPLPKPDDLKHSGRRALALFEVFPWKDQTAFGGELGEFTLADDERL